MEAHRLEAAAEEEDRCQPLEVEEEEVEVEVEAGAGAVQGAVQVLACPNFPLQPRRLPVSPPSAPKKTARWTRNLVLLANGRRAWRRPSSRRQQPHFLQKYPWFQELKARRKRRRRKRRRHRQGGTAKATESAPIPPSAACAVRVRVWVCIHAGTHKCKYVCIHICIHFRGLR